MRRTQTQTVGDWECLQSTAKTSRIPQTRGWHWQSLCHRPPWWDHCRELPSQPLLVLRYASSAFRSLLLRTVAAAQQSHFRELHVEIKHPRHPRDEMGDISSKQYTSHSETRSLCVHFDNHLIQLHNAFAPSMVHHSSSNPYSWMVFKNKRHTMCWTEWFRFFLRNEYTVRSVSTSRSNTFSKHREYTLKLIEIKYHWYVYDRFYHRASHRHDLMMRSYECHTVMLPMPFEPNRISARDITDDALRLSDFHSAICTLT